MSFISKYISLNHGRKEVQIVKMNEINYSNNNNNNNIVIKKKENNNEELILLCDPLSILI